ncbi:MAG: histidine triad nucleotide-binding protein [Chloroflexi bacterium RBG_13_51_52]|nr:MAG: histidine triad nucleotide-binding protein [Chloroflexi bacterium RBG_13_51_52]
MNPEKNKTDCVFCKIVSGEIPSKIIYRDKEVVVFPDINPVAPVHLLVVPVKHLESLADMKETDTALTGKMVAVANRVAREQGLAKNGYRLIINCGADAGQLVQHLHIHLMGGRALKWEN